MKVSTRHLILPNLMDTRPPSVRRNLKVANTRHLLTFNIPDISWLADTTSPTFYQRSLFLIEGLGPMRKGKVSAGLLLEEGDLR